MNPHDPSDRPQQRNNIFQNLMHEANAYTSIETIEASLEQGESLANLPMQPLYVTLKNLPTERVGEILPSLSKSQRTVFLDLDIWSKDDVDVIQFEFWINAYSACQDEAIRKEFITGVEFAIFLKSRFNIWTFDAEDPQYPDHDNYFLTDDGLLLFEFDEDCLYISQIRQLVREIYGDMGVEKAYAYLFKIVSDSFLTFQEEEYRFKKLRLDDYGFVDYYDALELEATYSSIEFMHAQFRKKKKFTGKIDPIGAAQALHRHGLVPFQKDLDGMTKELEKVKSDSRLSFLQFNFIRLINGTLVLKNAMKDGPMSMNRVGQQTRAFLELGGGYLIDYREKHPDDFNLDQDESLLELFNFSDLYKIGATLIRSVQKNLKKYLGQYSFDGQSEKFLGAIFLEFLEYSFDWPVKAKSESDGKYYDICNLKQYNQWQGKCQIYIELLPFMDQFHLSFNQLLDDGRLDNSYYLNYTVEEIDWESIILSSFANHALGIYSEENEVEGKMGLTIDEYRKFLSMVTAEGSLKSFKELKESIVKFKSQFGLNEVLDFNDYMYTLLQNHLDGYDITELKDEDYRHVGGPIILNVL